MPTPEPPVIYVYKDFDENLIKIYLAYIAVIYHDFLKGFKFYKLVPVNHK